MAKYKMDFGEGKVYEGKHDPNEIVFSIQLDNEYFLSEIAACSDMLLTDEVLEKFHKIINDDRFQKFVWDAMEYIIHDVIFDLENDMEDLDD